MSLRIGIDVGGTFTDFLLAPGDRPAEIHKTLSTPEDPVRAVLDGLGELARLRGGSLRELLEEADTIVHGTTIATNAVLTGEGAVTGLITTAGFRDILQMRGGIRERPYDNNYSVPEPLVPGQLRKEIAGRLRADGSERDPIDEQQVLAVGRELQELGAQTLAVCLMHAHASDRHERRVADLLRSAMPEVYLSVSSEIAPIPRLYDRASTVALNAYVGPLISRYLATLRKGLAEHGFAGVLLIMQSNGGIASPEVVTRVPANTFLSGPAAAPRAAVEALRPHRIDRCITADMGGTSFDACLIEGGAALGGSEGHIGRWRLALPTLEIHTIGAGGGSIAWVDRGGLLHVGPQSAGASPGPVCYGFGGDRPTVTDADLVLGLIDAESFHGGRVKLDLAAAEAAIVREIAEPLGMDLLDAAAGIYDLVCATMAEGIREVSVKRGLDPREFPLLVAGGAGPLHSGAIAAMLEMPLVVIPRASSIFCAAGMLAADFKHDLVRSCRTTLRQAPPGTLEAMYRELELQGRKTLLEERIPEAQIKTRRSFDARYVGQWYDVTVALPDEASTEDRDLLAQAFHARHEELYGYRSDGQIQLTALRLSAIGETQAPRSIARAGAPGGGQRSQRVAYLGRPGGFASVDVHNGAEVLPGDVIRGPALIEEPTTTIVVPAEHLLCADDHGAFLIARREMAGDWLPAPLAELAR